MLWNELDIFRVLDHPNIVQFYEIYQDGACFHFVMECCEGGDLAGHLEKHGPLSEEQTKEIIFQALLTVNHLHSCGIVHSDIKPDNYLFKTKHADSQIKLVDFGLSKRMQADSPNLKSILGTPYYLAPEVLEQQGYGYKCDVWSIGVMMYVLLAADFPFKGPSQAETFEKIRMKKLDLEDHEGPYCLSKKGKEFIFKLLDKNPENRYSAREALRDPWFEDITHEMGVRGRSKITPRLLRRLRDFRAE